MRPCESLLLQGSSFEVYRLNVHIPEKCHSARNGAFHHVHSFFLLSLQKESTLKMVNESYDPTFAMLMMPVVPDHDKVPGLHAWLRGEGELRNGVWV